MKKLLALLLATLMCFSLVACGGDAKDETGGNADQSTDETTQQKNDIPKEIELTVDNWQDYLEIKSIPSWNYNDFNELESFDQLWNVLCLKEKYADMKISKETKVAFEYTAREKYVAFEADPETEKLIMGDVISEKDVTLMTSYDSSSLETRVMLANLADYNPVALLNWGGNNHQIIVLENVAFTRIEGTLVFE